jgi:hypothetical protein
MVDSDLYNVLRQEAEKFPPELDRETIDRILTEPQQKALAHAILADAVDALPVIGDLLATAKREKAERRGIEYPTSPIFAQDTLGDLPTPFDWLGELLVAYHVPYYLQRKYGIEVRDPITKALERLSERTGDLIASE